MALYVATGGADLRRIRVGAVVIEAARAPIGFTWHQVRTYVFAHDVMQVLQVFVISLIVLPLIALPRVSMDAKRDNLGHKVGVP